MNSKPQIASGAVTGLTMASGDNSATHALRRAADGNVDGPCERILTTPRLARTLEPVMQVLRRPVLEDQLWRETCPTHVLPRFSRSPHSFFPLTPRCNAVFL